MLKVGLTGGIGSGKSAVAARLVELGATLIDADVLAREVVAPGTPGLAAVVAAFGTDVLTADGALDRERLSRVVFADEQSLARLNAIVHPLVGQRTAALVERAAADAIVVHDVPLLVENGLAPAYDVVVVVFAEEGVRRDRLIGHRGMTEAQVRARMAAQASDDARRAVADVVIDNSGKMRELHEQVDRVWADLLARPRR
ncbi:dephospho-CoA kinase [soil metagenome]